MGDPRRTALRNVQPGAGLGLHAGLWLDKGLSLVPDDPSRPSDTEKGAKAKLFRELDGLPQPVGYRQWLRARQAELASTPGAVVAFARVQGRLILGLGAKGPAEAGLRLDQTWGVPMLPGSSLKGVAAAAAHVLTTDEAWRKADQGGQPGASHGALFGHTGPDKDEQGAVCFLDAWWWPESEDDRIPIHMDVMTVHHQDYYQREDDTPPSDMDDPNPVPFASVTGKYLIAVVPSGRPVADAGDNEIDAEHAWCEAAIDLLGIGMRELGVGAKTNAGYGRMELAYTSAAAKAQQDAEVEAQLAAKQAAETLQQQEEALRQQRAQQAAAQAAAAAAMAVWPALSKLATQVTAAQWLVQVTDLLNKAKDLPADRKKALALMVVDRLRRDWLLEARRRQTPAGRSLAQILGPELQG